MPRKKPADPQPDGTLSPDATGTATLEPPASPPDLAPTTSHSEALAETSDGNGTAYPPPLKTFSYMVSKDVYVLASVRDRLVTLASGEQFLSYDTSVRKRYRDKLTGEWKSAYSFHAGEIYAVQHALAQAAAFIAERRAAECPF